MKLILRNILWLSFCFSVFNVNSQTIEQLLQEAVDNNPELKALELQYEASLTKGKQVSQLPQPQVGVGIPINSPETRLGPQHVMVSAVQMFPWFGTLSARRELTVSMANSKFENIAAEKLNLFYEIKYNYYNLYLLDGRQKIIAEQVRIYEALESVSFAKVESGTASSADVLRIQIRKQDLLQQIKIFQNEKQLYFANINEVTRSPFDDTIVMQESFDKIAGLEYDLEVYRKKINQHHPLMLKLEHQIAVSRNEERVNSVKALPSIGLGLDYSLVGKRDDADPEFNGRDIIVPKAMISVPIYRKEYKAKREEEKLKQEAIQFQKEQTLNSMLAKLEAYKVSFDNAILKIELIEDQLKKAESAFEILLSEYSADGEHFNELMMLRDQIIGYDLDVLDARMQTHLAKARIDRLTDF